jgi:hypothetical protein
MASLEIPRAIRKKFTRANNMAREIRCLVLHSSFCVLVVAIGHSVPCFGQVAKGDLYAAAGYVSCAADGAGLNACDAASIPTPPAFCLPPDLRATIACAQAAAFDAGADPIQGISMTESCLYACPAYRDTIWGRLEYLSWWNSASQAPPLVTTAPAASASIGQLGAAGTEILLAGRYVDEGMEPAGRGTLGCWLDARKQWSISATYLSTGRTQGSFFASTDGGIGSAILAEPIYDQSLGAQSAYVIGGSSYGSGNVNVVGRSQFRLVDVDLKCLVFRGYGDRVCGSVGFRKANLVDTLGIVSEAIWPLSPIDYSWQTDDFSTRNRFNGLLLGVEAEFRRRTWRGDAWFKLGIGSNRQFLDVRGYTESRLSGGLFHSVAEGAYAKTTNSGAHRLQVWGVMPEVGLRCGRQIGIAYASLGYTCVYWDRVLRPGEQVNHNIGQGEPRVPFLSSSFTGQAISAGLEFTY